MILGIRKKIRKKLGKKGRETKCEREKVKERLLNNYLFECLLCVSHVLAIFSIYPKITPKQAYLV